MQAQIVEMDTKVKVAWIGAISAAIAAAIAIIPQLRKPKDAVEPPFIVPTAEPSLTGVSIQFHTTRDNKDHDTKLFVWVMSDGDTVAEKLGFAAPNMQFDSDSNSPVFDLQKVDATMKKSRLKKGVRVRVKMETVGDDNWWFKFTV